MIQMQRGGERDGKDFKRRSAPFGNKRRRKSGDSGWDQEKIVYMSDGLQELMSLNGGE